MKHQITSIAIGKFDGIHKGHMKLIEKLGPNGALVVIDMHNASLTPYEKRSQYAKKPCFYFDFELICKFSGAKFVAFLKNEFKNLKKIIVGYDFRFGYLGKCDANDLKKLYDGEVEIIKEYRYKNQIVHSSAIKDLILKGQIAKANALLGREYTIEGDIIKGQGIGKKELFATLNMQVERFLIPKNGVYASRIIKNNKIYNGVSFIGIRLSTDGGFAIENHILDEVVDFSDGKIEVAFVEFLRENKTFSDLAKLKAQIASDIKKAREILNG